MAANVLKIMASQLVQSSKQNAYRSDKHTVKDKTKEQRVGILINKHFCTDWDNLLCFMHKTVPVHRPPEPSGLPLGPGLSDGHIHHDRSPACNKKRSCNQPTLY